MNAMIVGGLVVLVASVLSALGVLCVRRIVGLEVLKSFNEVAGNMFQVVGTLYAVLLGLIVVDAMTDMNDLRVTLEEEANDVADVFILARALPVPIRPQVEKLCTQYVDAVIDKEWEAMRNQSVSKEAIVSISLLWDTLLDFKPQDDDQKEIKSMCLSHLSEMGDHRRKRLLASVHGVSNELWAVLTVGGLLTLGFSYFLGLHSVRGQILMTAIIGTSLALNVYLVYLFGYPLSGAYALEPDPFMADRAIFKMRASGAYKSDTFKDVNLQDVLHKR